MDFKLDGFVKSLNTSFDVIPAKAGIQCFQIVLDACLRRHDGISDFLRVCQTCVKKKRSKGRFFPQPKDRATDHIRIEERSIVLHRAIADRIRTNPRLMEKAGKNLQKYLEHIIKQGLVQEEILGERISMLHVEKSIKDRILKRIDK